MPTPVDISAVNCKLFGVSFLKDEEHEKMRKLWGENFYPYTAFFVRGESGMQVTQIAQSLRFEIQRQNIPSIAGESVIIALFLDMTEEVPRERIEAMGKLPGLLQNALHCNVSVVFQFGYVGELAFSNAAVQRENAKIIVDENMKYSDTGSRRQLCLVASPTLTVGGIQNWKAVAVFLDVLRRQANPTQLIPGTDDMQFNNDVGFLSYGEHSASQQCMLSERSKHLTRLLGNRGGEELRQALEQRLAEMESALAGKYHIDGSAFPLHTGLIVEDTFLHKNKKKATRGEYLPYNDARNNVSLALSETARVIQEDIACWCQQWTKGALRDLEEIIDSKEVGLELLEEQRSVLSYLDVQIEGRIQPQLPSLQYKEAGCLAEIVEYMEKTIAFRIKESQLAYVEAIKEAYKSIAQRGFAKKKEDYSRELQLVNMRLSGMCDAREFYTRAISGHPDKQADFHPFLPTGKENSFILVRGLEMQNIANSITSSFAAPATYSISEKNGGTPVLDDAPMKVLGVMFKDCDEENLLDLIPEVLV